MRWSGCSRPLARTSSSSRSSVSARCEPRLLAGDRVDLVHDHGLRLGERLARPRGQHQVQRLGRRDQDVGRPPQQRLALLLGRVAGADPDPDRAPRPGSPVERHAQVALDVVAERLQRGDVDHPVRLLRLSAHPAVRLRTIGHLIDRPEERRQRLARPRGRRDQRALAAGDRRPALRLRRRGLAERALEPVANGRREVLRAGGVTTLSTPGVAVYGFSLWPERNSQTDQVNIAAGKRERDRDRDRGDTSLAAQEAVADRVHHVEERVRVGELVPGRGQDVDGVEHAADERQRLDHEVLHERVVVPRLGVDADDHPERGEQQDRGERPRRSAAAAARSARPAAAPRSPSARRRSAARAARLRS